MFSEVLQELRRSVRSLAPETLSGPQAAALMEQFSEVKRLASAAETLLAARVAETGAWQADGDRSPGSCRRRKPRSSRRPQKPIRTPNKNCSTRRPRRVCANSSAAARA